MIFCVVIPEFVISLEQKTISGSTTPVIVFTQEEEATVYALCQQARQAGVMLGMSQSKAVSACQDAIELIARPKYYQQEAKIFAERLLLYTDRIEIEQTANLIIWLDCGKLPPAEVAPFAQSISQTVQEYTPTSSYIGVADGRWTARIAALTGKPKFPHIIPIGEEQAFLGKMP